MQMQKIRNKLKINLKKVFKFMKTNQEKKIKKWQMHIIPQVNFICNKASTLKQKKFS